MKWWCWPGLRWLCPFRRPPRQALPSAPVAVARRDFDHARDRLTGANLDLVDTSELAARGAAQARDRVWQVAFRAGTKAGDSPIMRAANEAAEQVSDRTDRRDDA